MQLPRRCEGSKLRVEYERFWDNRRGSPRRWAGWDGPPYGGQWQGGGLEEVRVWLAATNGFSLGFKKGKPPVALPQARRAAMGKKQQPSPPSETFVDAAQLPAAEILLAGERLVSVVARNVESGRLSERVRASMP